MSGSKINFDKVVHTFADYSKYARETAQYPRKGNNPFYPILGLNGETGEVADQVKRIIRDDNEKLTIERISKIGKEIGDCCWYLQQTMLEAAIPMNSIDGLNIPLHQINNHMTAEENIDEIVSHTILIDSLSSNISAEMLTTRTVDANLCVELLEALASVSKRLGLDLRQLCIINLEKLYSRKERGVIQGQGEDR